MDGVALLQPVGDERPQVVVELEVHLALGDQDALVLGVVELERERLSCGDVEDLAEVAIGYRPAILVSPWLLDADVLAPPNRPHDHRPR